MSMKGLKFILILFFFSFPLSASDKIRVLIIHSYSQEYEWTKLQHNGFISALNAGNHTFEVYTEYLDTKRIKLTPSYIINFTNYLKMKYADAKPDLIYVTDDNALNFILENHSQLYKKDSYVPVFFSGVNNLKMDAVLPKNLFRGVFEKKEIKQNIELIKQFSPQTRKIYIVGDDSNTYDSIKKELTVEESNFSKMKFHYASDKYVSKVIEKLPKDEKIFVILATIGNLINDNNQTMLVQESIKTLKENRKLIILTMEDAYMRDGVVGGYVTSGERQGEEAAQLVLKYLKNKSLKEVSSIKEGSNIYIFNVQELSKARILLSQYVRRVSKIINPNESFMQKNELLILEILVVTLLIVIFSVTATYALQRKKFTEQVEELTRMQADKDELYSKEILLSHVLQEENMAYWKVNALTGELHLSSELIDKLRINMRVYKNDKDLLSYFIHFNDKKLFHDKLEEVKSSKESLLFFHRIINANNKILNIKHLLYFEQREQDAPASIIGIIKFDE